MEKQRDYQYLLENYTTSLLNLTIFMEQKLDVFLDCPSIAIKASYFDSFEKMQEEKDPFVQIYNIYHFFKINLQDVCNNIEGKDETNLIKYTKKYNVNSSNYINNFNLAKELNKKNMVRIADNIEQNKHNVISTEMNEAEFKSHLVKIKELIGIYDGISMSFTRNFNDEDYEFPQRFRFFRLNILKVSVEMLDSAFSMGYFMIIQQRINNANFNMKNNYLRFDKFKNRESTLLC